MNNDKLTHLSAARPVGGEAVKRVAAAIVAAYAKHRLPGTPVDLDVAPCDLEAARAAILAFSHEQIAENANCSSASDPRVAEALPRYRHKARGTEYDVLGIAELQAATGSCGEGTHLVVYRGDDGRLWARRHNEFGDGRFECLDPYNSLTASKDAG